MIDPQSKFVLAHVQGRRDEKLIRRLLEEGDSRQLNRQDLAIGQEGEAAYRTLFPEIFGYPYQPTCQGSQGRLPNARYRIPHSAAHVQIVKHRQGQRLTKVEIRYVHGSFKCIAQALTLLGYAKPNTSTIERRNGTARRMSAAQVRKTLAFSHREDSKFALGW